MEDMCLSRNELEPIVRPRRTRTKRDVGGYYPPSLHSYTKPRRKDDDFKKALKTSQTSENNRAKSKEKKFKFISLANAAATISQEYSHNCAASFSVFVFCISPYQRTFQHFASIMTKRNKILR
jgi:hypothetical protein